MKASFNSDHFSTKVASSSRIVPSQNLWRFWQAINLNPYSLIKYYMGFEIPRSDLCNKKYKFNLDVVSTGKLKIFGRLGKLCV